MSQPYVILPPNGSEPCDEWIRLGMEAQLACKFADAERHYRQALRLRPNSAVATQNLAVLLAQQNNVNEALLTIERAAMLDGVMPVIHVNRAFMNLEADRIDEAKEAARYAMEIANLGDKPEDKQNFVASRLANAMVSTTGGHAADAVSAYDQILDLDSAHAVANPNACFVQTLIDSTVEDLARQRKRWYEANRFTGTRQPHSNGKQPGKRLKVGYVGGDFKRHSAAMIFGNVILNHSQDVDVYLYSSLPVDPASDDMTRRFQAKVAARTIQEPMENYQDYIDIEQPSTWRDITTTSDEDADKLVRRDGIDILVDLAGHTNGGRLGLFCRKPAPVQVTAWGFAHGTGVPEIDYFFADPIAVTEEERQHFTERIVDLPCVVTYLPPEEYKVKGTSTLPYFINEHITFGTYARFEKLSDSCLRTFAEILRRVPGSKLEFKDHAFRRPYSLRRVRAAMQDVDPQRLLFSISTTHPDHMLAYQQADVCLDPFPHGGGVVAMEQLYMGVPLVTLRGRQPSGRTAASVLTTLGMSSWVAESPEHYVEIAVSASQNIPVLQQARRELRDKLLQSPIVAGYAVAVEARYREMWEVYCAA